MAKGTVSRPALNSTFSTSFLADYLVGDLKLPESLDGAVVVDVGAGGSNAAEFLRKKGADAYAVDPRYDNGMQSVKDSVRQRLGVVPEEFDPSRISDRVRGWLMRNLGGNAGKNQHAFERMLFDATQHRDKYVRAYADRMPFPDGFADLVFSVEAVSAFLMDDPRILRISVREMLRVLKPGGTMQIIPWPDIEAPARFWDPKQVRNAREVQRGIEDDVKEALTAPTGIGYAQLVVVK